MEYVKLGQSGVEVSRFGLGCMRLPLEVQADGTTDSAKIDEPKAIEMIRYAIDNGVNYVDTAHGYHGGNSKIVLGKALTEGYRERAVVVSKLPHWDAKTHEDFDRLLDEHLEALQTDHLDIWLVHALSSESWEKCKKLDVFTHLENAKASGKVKMVGFSFHDELPVFKEIIDAYDWDICQIQLNILDVKHQAGLEGLYYAAEKGIPVTIMEPLKGGRLAGNVPADIIEKWNTYKVKRSPQDWAFRWLAHLPEATVILSGSSTLDQLKNSLEIFEDIEMNEMTDEEIALVDEVRAMYESKIKVDCTDCKYCMPCPFDVNIPGIFKVWNTASMYDDFEEGRREYKKIYDEEHGQDHCVACGNCESVCPQQLSIIQDLIDAHAALA